MEYKVSSGLSRPDFYDWPQRMIDQIVDWNPDATAVLFGANDGRTSTSHGKVLKVGTKAWQAQYAKRVGKAMSILTKGDGASTGRATRSCATPSTATRRR